MSESPLHPEPDPNDAIEAEVDAKIEKWVPVARLLLAQQAGMETNDLLKRYLPAALESVGGHDGRKFAAGIALFMAIKGD